MQQLESPAQSIKCLLKYRHSDVDAPTAELATLSINYFVQYNQNILISTGREIDYSYGFSEKELTNEQ